MKKQFSAFLSVMLSAAMLCGCGSQSAGTGSADTSSAGASSTDSSTAAADEDWSQPLPSDYSGTLTSWGWDDTYWNTMTAAFQKKYPNVKFEYTPMANGDTLQKYQTALSTGTDLPDVGWAIVDSRAKVYELDMWEDLSQAPYNFSTDEVLDFTVPRLKNSKGMVCGIEQSITPACFAYRKDLAKEYLGTDDPKELEAMLSTWEDFAAKGKEVNEKSGGKVFMMQSSADAQQFICEQGGQSWITDKTVNMTKALKRSLEVACMLRDSKACDNLEAWSPQWYASFGEDTHIFAGCAPWSVKFNIEPNDPKGESEGYWGLMNAPEGNISWGGTTLGITKTCKDKRLAWEFIKFCTLSTDGAKAMQGMSILTSSKKAYEEDPGLWSFKSAWFGDLDLGQFYSENVIPTINPRPMNYDDNVIRESLNNVNTAIINDSSMTAEGAMEMLKEDLETNLPDYTIE